MQFSPKFNPIDRLIVSPLPISWIRHCLFITWYRLNHQRLHLHTSVIISLFVILFQSNDSFLVHRAQFLQASTACHTHTESSGWQFVCEKRAGGWGFFCLIGAEDPTSAKPHTHQSI